jgi:small subunit ribosomal protein S1
MSKSFAEMLNEGFSTHGYNVGSIVKATVVDMNKDFIWVDAGLKSECAIAIDQFKDAEGVVSVCIGDQVDVALEAFEDSAGETKLSREKAKRAEIWGELEKSSQDGVTIKGTIINKVKGGFTVDLGGVRAFLPGSLVDVRPLKDTTHLESGPIDIKVIKIDPKRNNIVVSRRAVVEEESSVERGALLGSLAEGQVVKGVVKNLTDYGAFIDLGGIDGLLHITDISWSRIRHPSEMIAVGDELTLTVLRFDAEKGRVSLGLKQLAGDPWGDIGQSFSVGSKVKGKVTNIADYGCFVELKNGVEGLIHVSEMDWTNKNVNPHKIVQLGSEIEVMILEIDMDRRRISLGLKQCVSNPWERFAKEHAKGDVVKGKIKSITDFGIFLGLAGDIDGLIHLSDLSWTVPGEVAVRDFKKGDEIEAVVLSADADRERISLGIKQMEGDRSAGGAGDAYQKGNIVKGSVLVVDEKKGLEVDLGEGMVGHIRRAELSRDRVEDLASMFKVGSEVEAIVTGVDKKSNMVNLSIKAMNEAEEKEALRSINKSEEKVTTTLGDLIKEKMGKIEE